MTDPLIEDQAIVEEIDLLSELVITASQSTWPLTCAEIDATLGVYDLHSASR